MTTGKRKNVVFDFLIGATQLSFYRVKMCLRNEIKENTRCSTSWQPYDRDTSRGDGRPALLQSFRTKYGHQLHGENQPKDSTLALTIRMRGRRAVDFVSLANAGSESGANTAGAEPSGWKKRRS